MDLSVHIFLSIQVLFILDFDQRRKLNIKLILTNLKQVLFWKNKSFLVKYDFPSRVQHTIWYYAAATAAKFLQSCPTLCDPVDGRPPGSWVHGILQARVLEWVAITFSNALKWKVKVKSLSRVRLLATPWTAVYQAPASMGFSRQEYWSGLPLPSPILYYSI